MSLFFSSFQNLDLLSIAVSVAGMMIMGFAVLFNDLKGTSNRIFFYLAMSAGVWSVVNYLSYQGYSIELSFWFFRLVLFWGVLASFFTFTFSYVFPESSVRFPKYYKWVIVPLTFITALITLTPLVFSEIAEATFDGRVSQIILGPGIYIFGGLIMFLNLGGLFFLIRKVIQSSSAQRRSLQIILFGFLLMLALILTFNFILPAFFNTIAFIPLGALFLFPFIAFTAYAILRHNLFNLRVAGASVLIFFLAIVTFLEVILAQDKSFIVYRSGVFLMVLALGIILIRGVLREVKQREEIEHIALKLEDANVKLQKLDKAKSEFLSIASHQLRSPLTAIKGYISLFLEGSYGQITEEMKKRLQNVYEANERLIKLINDLLNISRIESGKTEAKIEKVDLKELVQSVVQELDIKAKEKSLTLQVQNAQAPQLVRADKDKLRNVILNLVDNAIKYTSAGSITIKLTQKPPVYRIEVTDTGEGMDAKDLERMFQSFTRGEAGAKHWTGGSGLGLYIAKEFVKLHKGKIWAESAGKGKGSTFIAELPL